MKKLHNKKVDDAIKCIVLIIICYYFISIFIKWNYVPHFKNYIYMSHPMSIDASDNNHFSYVDADLVMSNEGLIEESYAFNIEEKEKRTDIKPRVSSIDTLGAYFAPTIINRVDVSLGIQLLNREMIKHRIKKIANTFGVIRVSSPCEYGANRLNMKSYKDGSKNGFIIHREGVLKDVLSELWYEENTFQEILEDLREWEKEEYRTSVFNFDSCKTYINSFYCFNSGVNNTIIVNNKKSFNNKLWDFMRVILTPYDISKAEYDYAVIANGIDSTNINIYFTEGVEISENKNIKEYNTHHIKLYDFGRRLPTDMLKIFYNTFGKEKRRIVLDGWELREFKQNETIQLSIQFLESRNWQWVRLFFLTSIITYLLVLIIKHIIRIIK